MPKGKNTDSRYVTIGGRVPLELRRVFKAQCALDGIDINTALELLVSGYVEGRYKLSPEQASVLDFVDKRKDKTPAKQQSTRGGSQPRPPAGDTELGRLRSQLGMSQRVFADAVGISQSAVGNYERGKVVTPEDVLERARGLLADTSGND